MSPFYHLIKSKILYFLEEDTHGTFSEILLRYFIAEGVLCSHGTLLVSSSSHNADEIFKVYTTQIIY